MMAWRLNLAWHPVRSCLVSNVKGRFLPASPLAWAQASFHQEARSYTRQSSITVQSMLIQSRPFSQQAASASQVDLSASELRHAARMARLSGFCYRPFEDLADSLEDEGLRLVARGQTHFTRWYVADGRVGSQSITRRDDGVDMGKDDCDRRIIILRGVVWRAGEFNARLWQDLVKFWPTSFEGDMTQPRNALVTHAGMCDMAGQLFHELRPFIVEAHSTLKPVTFGGHSLGGAFALLMACMARLRIQIASDTTKCYAFGAPPVLSRSESAQGEDVLQVMGLPEGSVKSFVLDNDPIPRAMLSVDPTFAMLKQSAPLSWVLEARRRFLGSGTTFTPERFLYENVGEVYLIRWTAESGQRVIPLAPSQSEQQLKLAIEELLRTPAALIQALLDHSHGSYSQELYAAARQIERRESQTATSTTSPADEAGPGLPIVAAKA